MDNYNFLIINLLIINDITIMDIKIKVGIIIANNKGEILLIKEKVEKKDKHLWNIIKGTYGDNGDESIFEAAQRECMEEASIKVKITNTLNCFVLNKKGKLRVQINFLAEINEGIPQIADQNEQEKRNENISEIKWFNQKKILQINPEEFVSNRAWKLINDYFSGKKYPIDIYSQE